MRFHKVKRDENDSTAFYESKIGAYWGLINSEEVKETHFARLGKLVFGRIKNGRVATCRGIGRTLELIVSTVALRNAMEKDDGRTRAAKVKIVCSNRFGYYQPVGL